MSATQQPRPMTIPSLAGALARKQNKKAPRSEVEPAGVGDVLAERTSVPSQLAPAESETPQIQRHATPVPRAAGPVQVAGKVRPEVSTRVYSQPMPLYLPRSLHQKLGSEAEARKSTKTALILQAVNATHLRVGEVLSTATDPAPTDLFAIPQRRTEAELTVHTTIRVTDTQLEAIEGLASTHSVNRSQIIAAAVRLYLEES